jgi:hypothetical protein
MAAAQTPVLVHLLDPVPGIVVTKIVEGLRALGMDAELRRGDLESRRTSTAAAPRVVLTRGEPDVELDDRSALVTLPAVPRTARLDRLLADAMLTRVLKTLRGLAATA